MKEEKRKLVCRVWFLAICLLPTVIQLWSIFGAQAGKPLANAQRLGRGDDQDAGAILGNESCRFIKSNPVEEALNESSSVEKWAAEQGIDQFTVAATTMIVNRSDLPASHALNELSFQQASISESDTDFSWWIDQLTLNQSNLAELLNVFVAKKFHTVWREHKQNSFRVNELVVKRGGSGNREVAPGQLVFRGVTVSVQDRTFERIRITGRLITGPPEKLQSVELPFECEIAVDGEASLIEFNGRALPVWLLSPFYCQAVGERAEFSGFFKQTRIPRMTSVTELSGSVTKVDCGLLSASLSRRKNRFLSGECYLQNFSAKVEGNQVVSFAGEFQSASTGSVSSEIVNVLGASTKWLSGQTLQPYRSFLLGATFQKGQLRVQSKYSGGQLIWSDNGTDILVSNR